MGKTVKAFWRGYEIYEIDFRDHSGWRDICFWMSDYESPITGTGRCLVRMEEIVLEAA